MGVEMWDTGRITATFGLEPGAVVRFVAVVTLSGNTGADDIRRVRSIPL